MLTDEKGNTYVLFSLNMLPHPKVGGIQQMIGSALREFYGCCEGVLDGVTIENELRRKTAASFGVVAVFCPS